MSSRLLKAFETVQGPRARPLHSVDCETGRSVDLPPVPDLVVISRERGEAIIQEALEGASRIAARAKEEGYAAGKTLGYDDGMALAQALVTEANQRLALLEQERLRLLSQAEMDIVRLATKVASLILKREVKQDPEAVLAMVRDALTRVRDEGAVTVRLNPLDAVIVRSNMPRLMNGTNVRGMNVEEDNGVEQAGCLVSTSRGDIDERLESQLRRITGVLEGVGRDGSM